MAERIKDWAARACLLPLLLAPVANPDLFWHLNVGARMLAEGRHPRDEAFSYTLRGTPWIDFEWLFQSGLLGIERMGGFPALWAYKAVLWGLAGGFIEALGRLSGGPARGRLLLVLWCAASLGRAELKPELFSVVFFLALLWVLEAWARGHVRPPRPRVAAAVSAAFFAAWANLHPGFPAGLGLAALYALFGRGPRRALAAAAAAGAVGTLLNPYGWGLWTVLLDHARAMDVMSAEILEWRPLSLENPFHLPQLALLAGAAAAAAAAAAARILPPRAQGRHPDGAGPPAALLAAAALAALAGLRHARHMSYAAPLAGLVLLEASAAFAATRPRPERWLRAGGGLAACAAVAFLLWRSPGIVGRPRAFDPALFPVEAVDFLEHERAEFTRRRVYNEWGWGGYLAWRLGPDFPVFMDGRYVFHPLLAEASAAQASSGAWRAFLDRWGVEWVLVVDRPRTVTLSTPRGPVAMEHYASYFHPLLWSLVHRDGTARVYVRRAAFPEHWVKTREALLPRR